MRFEIVSKEAWISQCKKLGFSEIEAEEAYGNIKLPARGTSDSCGYDFVSPLDVDITSDKTSLIPTGIRVFLDEGYFLMLTPRSSCIKRGYIMANNVGIIDRDYVNADNEGNIMVPLISTEKVTYHVNITIGEKIAQGIIIPFATVGDVVETTRSGGFGSTGKSVEENKEETDSTEKEEPVVEEESLDTDDIDNLFDKEEVHEKKEIEVSVDSEVQVEEKAPEPETEEPTTESDNVTIRPQQALVINDNLLIDKNVVNETIIIEIDRMIYYAKQLDPKVYFKLKSIKANARTLEDIENLFNYANNWISNSKEASDNPMIAIDMYIRDAILTLVNKHDLIRADYLNALLSFIYNIRRNADDETKVKAGQLIYKHTEEVNDYNINKLSADLATLSKKYSTNN